LRIIFEIHRKNRGLSHFQQPIPRSWENAASGRKKNYHIPSEGHFSGKKE
jgi:hypothetical protein